MSKSAKILIVVGAAVIAIAAAFLLTNQDLGPRIEQPQPTVSSSTNEVKYPRDLKIRVLASGITGPVDDTVYQRLKSAEEFAIFLKETGLKLNLEDVDFSKEHVLAIFAGRIPAENPSAIKVESIKEFEDAIEVKVAFESLADVDENIKELTPYQIIAVPAVDKTVRFE